MESEKKNHTESFGVAGTVSGEELKADPDLASVLTGKKTRKKPKTQ